MKRILLATVLLGVMLFTSGCFGPMSATGRLKTWNREIENRWAGQAVYLESSNPANDHRYVRAGFEPVGGFEAVRNEARVTAMWRSVGQRVAGEIAHSS